ncbi:MAG: SsrA-binding protein SmpB [Patescibacteria group bacterium]
MPVYATNKKARFDYDIRQTFEAGISLSGQEVKSARGGHISLSGSYVVIHGDQPYLLNARISPYPYAGHLEGYEPERSRILLLKQSEIDYIKRKTDAEGLTIVPLSVYTKGPKIKIEIALGKGKKKYDKRETIKNRENEREVKRKIKYNE